MPSPVAKRIAEIEAEIAAAGFTLTYRRFVEDSKSPGFPGQIAGRTSRADREVVIGEFATPSPVLRLRVLKHELRHVLEPEWDCGNRSTFDRRPDAGYSTPLTR